MKKTGLIGEKLGHSYSKMIHGKFADYDYELLEVKEDEIESLLKSGEYSGFNVTIPYKKTVMKYCDELSELAEEIGSVNTIVCQENGRIKGYNTDAYGFEYLLTVNNIDVHGAKCMVLGSGGASLTVQAVLKKLGAKEVVVISRAGENNYSNIEKHFDSEIIVNTTPVGMYPDNGRTPVELSEFGNCKGVLDLIYNPNRTKLILDAFALGIPASGGLEMLVAQAKRASELFTGNTISMEEMEDVTKEIRNDTLNTILIGMPGAGKSYIGKEIARRTGRKFVDTDDVIVEREGMTIPEIFDKKGETYFRKVETQVLEEVCKQTGLVIAAGGGIVTRKANYNIIRQNGMVIWVKRNLDMLETEGRPLSKTNSAEKLFEERKDAYKSWSDYFINNNEERE